MKKNLPLLLYALLMTVLLSSFASAENVRGPVVGFLQAGSGKEISFRLEELVVLEMPDLGELGQGIEIEITIPMEIRKYRDSFALLFYKTITPAPEKERRAYQGQRIGFEVLPVQQSLFFHIPVIPNHSMENSRTTVLLPRVPTSEYPLLFTILPVMKGIPSTLGNSRFTVIAREVMEDKGYLSLAITGSEEYRVMINGEELSRPVEGKKHLLPSGIHRIEIFRKGELLHQQTFSIEKGKTTSLEIALKNAETTLLVEAPELSQIYLDGEKMEFTKGKPAALEAGKHTLVCKLGDHSVSKTFTAERGKSYTISIFLDILLKEN